VLNRPREVLINDVIYSDRGVTMTDALATQHERRVARPTSAALDQNDPALVEPWDVNAAARAAELANHGDPAYESLTSLILRLLGDCVSTGSLVLDAGCGLGYLSDSMAQSGYKVVGIDPSRASIDRAIKKFDLPSFSAQTIEQAVGEGSPGLAKYDAIVANMVLHTTPNLSSFLANAACLIRPGGSFIATIPHPCFFLQTKESMFLEGESSSEVPFWIEFRIRGRGPHTMRVPYFHRAIAEYSEGFYIAGFVDVRIEEPKHIGPGRPNDIIAFYATKARDPRSTG
jgi:2-polyprenyl-3-methyl-5-hydroxy-6-metoxy-1,4-benzoquinol methylase